MKETIMSILALILFLSLAQSSFARQSAKLIVTNNTEATLQVWSSYYIDEDHFHRKSSKTHDVPPGERLSIDWILPIGLVTVYIAAPDADPSVEKITRSFQVNNPGGNERPRPRELTITPRDFNVDELKDDHARADVSVSYPIENEPNSWEVWIHDTSTTCCNSNCNGGSKIVAVAKQPTTVFAYHGTRSEKKLKGAEVLKGFKTKDDMEEWVCKQPRTRMRSHVNNIAILKNKCVSNVPCPLSK